MNCFRDKGLITWKVTVYYNHQMTIDVFNYHDKKLYPPSISSCLLELISLNTVRTGGAFIRQWSWLTPTHAKLDHVTRCLLFDHEPTSAMGRLVKSMGVSYKIKNHDLSNFEIAQISTLVMHLAKCFRDLNDFIFFSKGLLQLANKIIRYF